MDLITTASLGLTLNIPDTATDAAPKKRKRDLRVKGKEPEASSSTSSSSSRPMVHPDDRDSAGLAITVSNLLGRQGVHRDQFHKAFRVCGYCKRIVCNETSTRDGHICVIELEE